MSRGNSVLMYGMSRHIKFIKVHELGVGFRPSEIPGPIGFRDPYDFEYVIFY
jgi:hypothetical protein